MDIGNPAIQLRVRKEAVSVNPLAGSLSSHPVELDFSQLLKAVKVRAKSSKKSIANAIPFPTSNPVTPSKDKLVSKTNEHKSIAAYPANQLFVKPSHRTTNQHFKDAVTPVKDASTSVPQHAIGLQLPTEIIVSPLLQSDPLQILMPTKRDRSRESTTNHSKAAAGDTQQVAKPVFHEPKENPTTVKVASATASPTTNNTPNTVDPIKTKTSATPNRMPNEQTTSIASNSHEAKRSEINQFATPLDIKSAIRNQSAANLESPKHINAPTLPALIEKLGTEVRQKLRDGERSLELLVTAPLIGKVFIELHEKDGQWVAAFSADNAAMQDLLHRHRDQLSQSLTSTSGIPAEVIVANTNDNASFREQFAQSNGNTGSNTTKQSSSTREEAPREYLSRTTIRPRSLTATREWIA